MSEQYLKSGRGGVREGAGRKKLNDDVRRDCQIALRVSMSEKAELERRAQEAGLTLSKYLLQLIL